MQQEGKLMINPNQDTTEETLKLLKEGSYERMRVELKNTIETKMRDFEMNWNDIGRLLGIKTRTPEKNPSRGEVAKWRILYGQVTLGDLNTLAHLFSCEPYILFRPRGPWIKT